MRAYKRTMPVRSEIITEQYIKQLVTSGRGSLRISICIYFKNNMLINKLKIKIKF